MSEIKRPTRMPIHEIFGPTIEGEGMVIGRKTMFVRTGGCDYSCAWCDSAFTWNGEEKATMMTAQQVFDRLIEIGSKDGELNFDHVTLTGGNPALIRQPMADLIDLLHAKGIKIGLETQGSFYREWFAGINDLVISPKAPSSGMKTDFRKLDEILEKLEEVRKTRALDGDKRYFFTLKVVVFDDTDYGYAKGVHKRYPNIPFYLSVGNIDAKEDGDISGRLLRKLDWLMQQVLDDPEMNDVKPLPQLHTLVWANRRKV